MTDPFDALARPAEPREPRDSFRRSLRRRLLDELGLTPADLTIDLPERSRPVSTTTPEPATRARTVTAITPYLCVHDGAAAIDFYAAAFGVVEEFRVVGDDGRIGHAELTLGDARVQLSDEHPEVGAVAPRTLGGAGVSLSLTVADADAAFEQAVAAGARTDRPPEDQAHGNRMAVVDDPFGHRWFIVQPLGDFDLDEYARREQGYDVVAGPGARSGPAAADAGGIWAAISVADARASIRFAVDVLGFEERLVVPDESDPEVVVHSELRWPEGGVVQVATAHREGNVYSEQVGRENLYVITADPEAVLARCEAAGVDVIAPMREVDYAGRPDRMFSLRDPDGNVWTFGTYAG